MLRFEVQCGLEVLAMINMRPVRRRLSYVLVSRPVKQHCNAEAYVTS
jgi:hypothetical protein